MLKNWCQTFLTKKSMCFIMKTYSFLKARIEPKNIHFVLEFNEERRKNRSRMLQNALYGKTKENLRNGVDVRPEATKKTI